MTIELPFSVEGRRISDALGREVDTINVYSKDEELAEFIALAVSHHDLLVAALKALLKTIDIAIDRSTGDTFGWYHNEAMDNITTAEKLLREVEKSS